MALSPEDGESLTVRRLRRTNRVPSPEFDGLAWLEDELWVIEAKARLSSMTYIQSYSSCSRSRPGLRRRG